MAVYANGTSIFMYKGDTGQIEFTGCPIDKNYSVYFSIFDEDNNKIKTEIQGTFNQSTGKATITFTEQISNTLPVGEFTYAFKGRATVSGVIEEDTWIPETKVEGSEYVTQSAPSFTVYPKRVEAQ